MKEMKVLTKEYQCQFRFDKDTLDHLKALSNMFPYTAPMSVVVRELINGAFNQAVEEGLIKE